MTPKEAIQIVDQLVANTNATRQTHVQGQQAVQVLAKLVEEKEATPEQEKSGKIKT